MVLKAIGNFFKKAANAVVNVVKTVANVVTNPVGTLINACKSTYESLSGASQQPPVQPTPSPAPHVFFPSGASGSAASLMGQLQKPNSADYDLNSEKGMMDYKEASQKYTHILNMLTNLQQMEHENKMAIIRNFKA